MKLSTKSRYAVRCLINLAIHGEKQTVSIADIGNGEDISQRYLELIFAALKKAGFITSVRGSQGGYRLACNAKDITVYDVVQIMEHHNSIVDKQSRNDPMKRMLMQEIWTPIDENLKTYLTNLTIADLTALE